MTTDDDTVPAARIIGEAAPLIAAALAGHPSINAVTFTYGPTGVRVLGAPLTLLETVEDAMDRLDRLFTHQRWQARVFYTGGSLDRPGRTYTPPWLSRP